MKRLVVLLTCIALLGLGGTPVAAAETYDRVAQEETADDDGTDYGWIGLLGLAGLAGLLGRKRDDRTGARADR